MCDNPCRAGSEHSWESQLEIRPHYHKQLVKIGLLDKYSKISFRYIIPARNIWMIR